VPERDKPTNKYTDKPTDQPMGKPTDKAIDEAGAGASAKTADATSDEPFLKRWSRLKSDDEAGELAGAEAAGGGEVETALAESESEVAAIDPADLPDIESLDKDSDYSVFMQEGVPDALRSLALRKLFMSNPIFSVLDGLNDYDEDYSMLGIVAQKVATAYKPGRGFLEDSDLVQIDQPESGGDADDDDVGDGDIEDGDLDDGDAVARTADAGPDGSVPEPELLAANDTGGNPTVIPLSEDTGNLEPARSKVTETASSVRKPDKDGKTDA